MKFIAKRLNLLGILLLLGFSAAAAVLYFEIPVRAQKPKTPVASAPAAKTETYVCPMHPEVTSTQAGKCPECLMALVPASEAPSAAPASCGADHQQGCCAAKETAGEETTGMTLPAGHPPVPGYTVESGCPHSSTPSTTTPAKK